MIITQDDIDDFVRTYNRLRDEQPWFDEEILYWLAKNPQVVIASGYQEFVGCGKSKLYQSLVRTGLLQATKRPLFREFGGSWIAPTAAGRSDDAPWEAFRLEGLLKVKEMEKSFERDWREGRIPDTSRALGKRQDQIDAVERSTYCLMPSLENMIEAASKYIANPLVDPTMLVSPRLWTPTSQSLERDYLQTATMALIDEVKSRGRQLEDIKWREFEELVAELLRSRGMEIHRVKENPQGGRDIIARAELVPGAEIITIAIEVKHRAVIDRPIIQQSIQQNRHFPALMLVTSGRFTGGVIKEVAKPENRMRVILKDGVAIRDMIQTYKLAR